jgi:hypothetical protein
VGATLPLARRDDLLIEEVEDELLVYDKRDESAHRLNRTAAIVWRHCDGKRDVADLVAVLAAEVGDDLADEDLVMVALDNLAERDLIDGAPERRPEETMLSRRRFIRRVGTVGVAALALPVIMSLNAPPASAQGSPCECECYCECYCYCECICPCAPCPCTGASARFNRQSPGGQFPGK